MGIGVAKGGDATADGFDKGFDKGGDKGKWQMMGRGQGWPLLMRAGVAR